MYLDSSGVPILSTCSDRRHRAAARTALRMSCNPSTNGFAHDDRKVAGCGRTHHQHPRAICRRCVVVAKIARDHDVTKETVYYFVDGGPHDPEPQFPPLPRRVIKPRATSLEDPGPARRMFVKRLWQTAAKQVQDIQRRLDSLGVKSSEGDVRALAVLVKDLADELD